MLSLCNRSDLRFPVVPYAVGSSIEGHVTAVRGGLSIDVSRMNAVLRVSPDDLDCTVQPGVTREELNKFVRDTGLFFPIDPGANASIGGMASTRASGTNAVRYGTMRDNVYSLQVVIPDSLSGQEEKGGGSSGRAAQVIRAGSRARKSSAGYDLARLFVGSEGTLGILSEVTVKLHPTPESIASAVCAFPSVASAASATIAALQMGVPLARVEILDDKCIDAVNRYSRLNLRAEPDQAMLFFEFHGTASSVKEQSEQVQSVSKEFGGSDFQWAQSAEERAKLWKARHDAYFASLNLKPGCKGMATDVCVPPSRLAECIQETKNDLKLSPVLKDRATIVGHVGDSNFHVILAVDENDAVDIEESEKFNERLVHRALQMEGTCTGIVNSIINFLIN